MIILSPPRIAGQSSRTQATFTRRIHRYHILYSIPFYSIPFHSFSFLFYSFLPPVAPLFLILLPRLTTIFVILKLRCYPSFACDNTHQYLIEEYENKLNSYPSLTSPSSSSSPSPSLTITPTSLHSFLHHFLQLHSHSLLPLSTHFSTTVGGNDFTPRPLPACFASLRNLEALFMANCHLRGPLPAWIGDLTGTYSTCYKAVHRYVL